LHRPDLRLLADQKALTGGPCGVAPGAWHDDAGDTSMATLPEVERIIRAGSARIARRKTGWRIVRMVECVQTHRGSSARDDTGYT